VSLRAIPHLITVFRLLCAPLIAWLLYSSRFREALVLLLFAGLSDWLDGFAARRLNSAGHVGVVLDPLADKVLLVTLFIVLSLLRLIPFWMLALAVGRDVVIVIGALLVHLLRGARKFLPSMLGKVSTFFQIVLILLALLYAAFPFRGFLWLEYIALFLSAFFTIVSGLDYVRRGVLIARGRLQPAQ
jgi:cardiolipin synthase